MEELVKEQIDWQSLGKRFPGIKSMTLDEKDCVESFNEQAGTFNYKDNGKIYECLNKSESEGCFMMAPGWFHACPACEINFEGTEETEKGLKAKKAEDESIQKDTEVCKHSIPVQAKRDNPNEEQNKKSESKNTEGLSPQTSIEIEAKTDCETQEDKKHRKAYVPNEIVFTENSKGWTIYKDAFYMEGFNLEHKKVLSTFISYTKKVETLQNGFSKGCTLSPQELAKRHGVSYKYVKVIVSNLRNKNKGLIHEEKTEEGQIDRIVNLDKIPIYSGKDKNKKRDIFIARHIAALKDLILRQKIELSIMESRSRKNHHNPKPFRASINYFVKILHAGRKSIKRDLAKIAEKQYATIKYFQKGKEVDRSSKGRKRIEICVTSQNRESQKKSRVKIMIKEKNLEPIPYEEYCEKKSIKPDEFYC